MVSKQINGGLLPDSLISINAANPNQPIFTINQGIQAGQALVLTFKVLVGQNVPPETYCNYFKMGFEGKVVASAPDACVNVGGGSIGDTIWRDWDGDGASNEQEGVAGTDAQDAQSTLRLHGLTALDASGTVFVLRWQGITNRFYSLSHRTGLRPSDPDWADVGDFLQVPGVDGFMSYTDRHGAVTRFYRLSVEQP